MAGKVCKCLNEAGTAYYLKHNCTTVCATCCPHGGFLGDRQASNLGRNRNSRAISTRRSVPTGNMRNRSYSRGY